MSSRRIGGVAVALLAVGACALSYPDYPGGLTGGGQTGGGATSTSSSISSTGPGGSMVGSTSTTGTGGTGGSVASSTSSSTSASSTSSTSSSTSTGGTGPWIDFCDFSNVSNLEMVGNAGMASPNLLRLTSSNGGQTSAAWRMIAIPVPAGTSVQTYFRFQLSNDCLLGGGDGFTFTLQGVGSAVLGNGGTSLGYGNALTDGGGGGITPSFAVEFLVGQITYSAQVALLANGNTGSPIAQAPPSPSIDSGSVVYVWIDFDGGTNMASVSMAGTATRPATPLFTGAANLSSLGSMAWAGFTAATGGTTCSDQDILEWEVSTLGSPCCPAAPGGACSGATPMCSASGLCEP